MAIRVFVSHSHEDHTLAEAVTALLRETLGLRDDEILDTSQSSTGLSAGSMVRDELSEAMASAQACLVLITPASAERPWVQFEAGGAFFSRKRIYLLLHPSAKQPHTLENIPTLIDRAEDVAKLIDALRVDLELNTTVTATKTLQAVSRFVGEVQAYNPEYAVFHCQHRLELRIGYGDLFEWPGPGAIALACDNRFDLQKLGEGSALYERALIGQFRRRFLKHLSRDDFGKHLVERLGGSKVDDRFDVGHVSLTPFEESAQKHDRKLFLVVLYTVKARLNGVIESEAEAPDVWRAYESLWTATADHKLEAVAAPLLGAGLSGAQLNQQQSCALAVLSAVCVALRQPIYPRLHLLCQTRDTYRALNVRAIADAAGLEPGPIR